MNKISNIWHKILNAVRGEAQHIDDVLHPIEQEIMEGAATLTHQILVTIGAQGWDAIKKGLSQGVADIAAGKDAGESISAVVKSVTNEVADDLKDAGKNAAYGAAAIVLAAINKPATAVDPGDSQENAN